MMTYALLTTPTYLNSAYTQHPTGWVSAGLEGLKPSAQNSTAQPTLANSIDEITHIYIRIRYARKSYPGDMKKLATLVSQFAR